VKADENRVAVMRGPIVYCLESVGNTEVVDNIFLSDRVPLKATYQPNMRGGVVMIQGTAGALFAKEPKLRPTSLTWTPYFAIANRGPTRMIVWLPRTETGVSPKK
jgi:DUF1680 family protein